MGIWAQVPCWRNSCAGAYDSAGSVQGECQHGSAVGRYAPHVASCYFCGPLRKTPHGRQIEMDWGKTISQGTWVQEMVSHGAELAVITDTQAVTAVTHMAATSPSMSLLCCVMLLVPTASTLPTSHPFHRALLAAPLRQVLAPFFSQMQKRKCLERSVSHLWEEEMGSDGS